MTGFRYFLSGIVIKILLKLLPSAVASADRPMPHAGFTPGGFLGDCHAWVVA